MDMEAAIRSGDIEFYEINKKKDIRLFINAEQRSKSIMQAPPLKKEWKPLPKYYATQITFHRDSNKLGFRQYPDFLFKGLIIKSKDYYLGSLRKPPVGYDDLFADEEE